MGIRIRQDNAHASSYSQDVAITPNDGCHSIDIDETSNVIVVADESL
jgi:hypothetical protein